MKKNSIPTLSQFQIIDPKVYYDAMPPLKDELYLWLTKVHIETIRGPIEKVIHETDGTKLFTDVLVVSPTPEYEYYTLVTSGMSFQPMSPPPMSNLPTHTRAEIYLHLPKDWKLDAESLRHTQWSWPVAWLLYVARYPHLSHEWLGYGCYMNCEELAGMGESSFSGCMLLSSLRECPDLGEVELNPLQHVFYYNLFPAYKEEIAKLEQAESCGNIAQLEELFIVNQVSGPINTKRKNVITNESY